MIDPMDLIEQHRYREAAVRYEALLKRNPPDCGDLSGHALALLCLGEHLEQALQELRDANAAESQEMMDEIGGKSQPELEEIGAVLWLLKRRKQAIATFRAGAEGMLNGSIEYGDLAGGASHGLLLWYAAVTAKDNESREFAERYLSQLARKGAYGKHDRLYWPEPLPLFLIGRLTREQVLMELAGASDVEDAITRARQQSGENKAIWDDLVQGLFYLAAHRRFEGREKECHSEMVRCASLENPITSVEWFLARAEAGYVPGSKEWPWPASEPKPRKHPRGRLRRA